MNTPAAASDMAPLFTGHRGACPQVTVPTTLASQLTDVNAPQLGAFVPTADIPETDGLWRTIAAWWRAIEVPIVTGMTTIRTGIVNTGIEKIKRSGRGFRNTAHYRAHILLASATRSGA